MKHNSTTKKRDPPRDHPPATAIFYILIGLAVLLLLHDAAAAFFGARRIPYSDFLHAVREARVVEISVGPNDIDGTFKDEHGRTVRFVTTRVDERLAEQLEHAGVKFTGRVEPSILPLALSWLIPGVLVAAVWLVLSRSRGRGAAGLLGLNKSRARVYVEDDTKVTFDDVAGVDEAKEELQEIVAFLKDPAAHGRLGGRLPRGILLVGPPGTGKTLLARAVAGEAGVPFFSINGSEFVEMFVGLGAARVRDLFEQARAKAPAIVFIDELDALGKARGLSPLVGGHDEKEQTLNQLLSELDGFDPRSGIVLLAATNRPEILDTALLRAGRFDRQVLVDRPDHRGRVQILNVHMRHVKSGPVVDLDRVASLTPGFTGADLANLCNEAALAATRRRADCVDMDDFTTAVERIVAGLEKKNRILNETERRTVAHHEMGHALVASALPGCDVVHKVSVIPRGIGALGYTIQRPTEDRFLMTKKELENKMAVLLAGRAAEDIVFAEFSTGAADDLEKATRIARSMVTRYGMTSELGQVSYEDERNAFLDASSSNPSHVDRSDATTREIELAVRELIDTAFGRARAILSAHSEVLCAGAELLLRRETLAEPDLAPLFEQMRAPSVSPPANRVARALDGVESVAELAAPRA